MSATRASADSGGASRGMLYDVADVTFSDQQIALAERVARGIAAREAVFGAYVSGSPAAGLGSPCSDLDVYVLVDRDTSYEEQEALVEGTRVQASLVSSAHLEMIVQKLARFDITLADRSQLMIGESDIELVVRLMIGRTLIPSSTLDGLRKAVSVDALRQILLSRWAWVIANKAEDAQGAVLAGDWPCALSVSALALEKAADSVLAAGHDFYMGSKFLFRRLARNPATRGTTETCWRLLQRTVSAGESPDRVRTLVERRMLAASSLSAWALIEAWDFPNLTPPTVRTRNGGPRRSPYFGLMRFGPEFGLRGPHTSFSIGPEMARIWMLADGSGMPTLLRRVAYSLGRERADIASGVERGLEAMRAQGAIVYDSSS